MFKTVKPFVIEHHNRNKNQISESTSSVQNWRPSKNLWKKNVKVTLEKNDGYKANILHVFKRNCRIAFTTNTNYWILLNILEMMVMLHIMLGVRSFVSFCSSKITSYIHGFFSTHKMTSSNHILRFKRTDFVKDQSYNLWFVPFDITSMSIVRVRTTSYNTKLNKMRISGKRLSVWAVIYHIVVSQALIIEICTCVFVYMCMRACMWNPLFKKRPTHPKRKHQIIKLKCFNLLKKTWKNLKDEELHLKNISLLQFFINETRWMYYSFSHLSHCE